MPRRPPPVAARNACIGPSFRAPHQGTVLISLAQRDRKIPTGNWIAYLACCGVEGKAALLVVYEAMRWEFASD